MTSLGNTTPQPLDVEAIASHFPNTRRLLEETAGATVPSPNTADAARQQSAHDSSPSPSPSRAASSRARVSSCDGSPVPSPERFTDGGNAVNYEGIVADCTNTIYGGAANNHFGCNRENDNNNNNNNNNDDEEDDEDMTPHKANVTRLLVHKRREEVSRTIQHRLDGAARRRDQLREARRKHLLEVERQRQAKTEQTRALRRSATEKFVSEAPKALETLRSAGLVWDVMGIPSEAARATEGEGAAPTNNNNINNGYRPFSADTVELILVSDPRTCDHCVAPSDLRLPVCPTLRQPHRRLLVVAAERFLKLIGDTRINLIPSTTWEATAHNNNNNNNNINNALSSATSAAQPPPTKAKRGISVNPQLFVLAYYNAVLPDGEVDPMLRDCAISMIHITEQLRQMLVSFAEQRRASSLLDRDDDDKDDEQHHNEDHQRGEDHRDGSDPSQGEPPYVPILTDAQEKMLKPLLIAFSHEWQRYSRLSNKHIMTNANKEDREAARTELVTTTTEALTHTYRRLKALMEEEKRGGAATTSYGSAAQGFGRSPLKSVSLSTAAEQRQKRVMAAAEVQALASFVAMLRARLARVGGAEELQRYDEAMAAREAADDDTNDGNGAARRGDGVHSAGYSPPRARANHHGNHINNNDSDDNSRRVMPLERSHYYSDGNATDGGYAAAERPVVGGSAALATAATLHAPLHVDPSASNALLQSSTSGGGLSKVYRKTKGSGSTADVASLAPNDNNNNNSYARAYSSRQESFTAADIVVASPLLSNGNAAPFSTSETLRKADPPSPAINAVNNNDKPTPVPSSSSGGPKSPIELKDFTIPRRATDALNSEYLGTSGSDTDLGGILPQRKNNINFFGPALPPLWSIGPDGKSHPPSESVLQREERSKLEYRARTAYVERLRRRRGIAATNNNNNNNTAARLPMTGAELEVAQQQEAIAKSFDDAMWNDFLNELDNERPPILDRIPHLLNAVAEALIEVLPRRIRSRVGQEIRDVLDWDVLRNRLRRGGGGTPSEAAPLLGEETTTRTPPLPPSSTSVASRYESIANLVTYVINRVAQLGAPAKEEALYSAARSLIDRLNVVTSSSLPTAVAPLHSGSDTIGSVVVEMFKFMFDAIRQLRADISAYSLQIVSEELSAKASEYEQAFFSKCFPLPDASVGVPIEGSDAAENSSEAVAITSEPTGSIEQSHRLVSPWKSTTIFIEKGLHDADTLQLVPAVAPQPPQQQQQFITVSAALPASILYITPADKKLFAALVAGVSHLLRSSGYKDISTRWDTYPTEALYFARPFIFEAANAVQLCTIRLMLGGTVSMIIAPHKVNGAVLQTFLKELDGKVNQWLGAVGSSKKITRTTTTAGTNNNNNNNNDIDDDDDENDEPPINTIEDVKMAISEAVSVFLGSQPLIGVGPTARPAAHPIVLSESEVGVLHGVIGKMTDVTSPQYTLFESRVMRGVVSSALAKVALSGSGLTTAHTNNNNNNNNNQGGAAPPSAAVAESVVGAAAIAAANAASETALRGCGALVSADVREVGVLVASIVLQCWEVHRGHLAVMGVV